MLQGFAKPFNWILSVPSVVQPPAGKMMSHIHSRAGELKSQGATEAAQDPDSKVSPEDAEQAITYESNKAGIAAYRFDPNASPEDKAAQVRSVS